MRIARLSNAFGPGQAAGRPQGVLTRFARDALAGRPLEVWGDGRVVRDYIHVYDAVAGLKALALADSGTLAGAAVFNIASGTGTSIRELVSQLEQALGRRLPVAYAAGRAFDVPYNVLDVSLAAERLGWRPRLGFAEGVRRLVDDLGEDPGRLFASEPAAEASLTAG